MKVQDGKNSKKQPVNLSNLEEADTNSTDFDKLVKNEYQRLLRQYRLMEDGTPPSLLNFDEKRRLICDFFLF